MSVAAMLAPSARNSTASSNSSSFQPVSRQNTIGSNDGSRSMRASKRYSHTALYLSMSAQDRDLEIEDELARGGFGFSLRVVVRGEGAGWVKPGVS